MKETTADRTAIYSGIVVFLVFNVFGLVRLVRGWDDYSSHLFTTILGVLFSEVAFTLYGFFSSGIMVLILGLFVKKDDRVGRVVVKGK